VLRAAIASKKIEIIAVNDPFLTTDYMVSELRSSGSKVTVDNLLFL